MAGYTRQSTYVNGDIIDASHSNDEFNALVSAFSQTNGHMHNSVDEGGYIPLISDTTNTNKVEVTASGARTTGAHEVTGNIVVSGTVDGRDIAVDGTKLDGIDAGATDDQTGAEIKAAYEAEPNAFTDAQFTKLSGIETGATADQTGSEIKSLYEAEANAFTDAQFTKLSGIETGATADQTGAEIKSLYQAELNAFTDAQFTKLSGIETGATADQTGAEIKVAYESELDTNAFTDAEKTKLAGIETSATADQNAAEVTFTPSGSFTSTDVQAAIEEAASLGGALTDAEVKTKYENNANTNAFTDAEQTKLSGIEASAKDDQVASEVPFTPVGTIAATDVQAAIAEVAQEAGVVLSDAQIKEAYERNANTNAFTDSNMSKLDAIETNAAADQVASEVPFTATGNIVATDVQAAIAELDTEKFATTGDTLTNYNVATTTAGQSATQTLDLNVASSYALTVSAATTIAFANVPANSTTVGLDLTVVGTPTITWPSSVIHPGGIAPQLEAGEMSFVLTTKNGGTTWKLIEAGRGFA